MSKSQSVTWRRPIGEPYRIPVAITTLMHAIGLALASGALAAATFLLFRSWSGGFELPLSGLVVLAAWTSLYAIVAASRIPAIIDRGVPADVCRSVTIDCLGTASLIALAVVVWLDASHLYLAVAVSFTGLVAESAWYARRFRVSPRPVGEGTLAGGESGGPNEAVHDRACDLDVAVGEAGDEPSLDVSDEEVGGEEEVEGEEEGCDGLIGESVERRVTREVLPEGGVRLHGLIRGTLDVGRRVCPIHLEFCPPFVDNPAITAYILQGEHVEVRLTQAANFGVRWEWQRPASASRESQEVVMFFEAIGDAG